MVRPCFALFLLCKRKNRIDMPRRLVDNLEGEVVDEELYECALGKDILSADLDGEDALLLNIRVDCVFGVTHDIGCFIRSDGIGKILKSLFNMCSKIVLTLVCDGNEAFGKVYGIHRAIVVDYHRLFGRLGVEDPHGNLLSSCRPFLSQIDLNVFHLDHVSMCLGRSYLARNDAILQHPSRLALADVEHLVKLLQGDDLALHG